MGKNASAKLVLLAVSIVLFSCTSSEQPASVVDLDDVLTRGDSGISEEIGHCCNSSSGVACWAYNCGDSTKGCVKWCAEN